MGHGPQFALRKFFRQISIEVLEYYEKTENAYDFK